MIAQSHLFIKTPGRGFINITEQLRDIVSKSNIGVGVCHVFIHHTSASILLCENADPLVQEDLENFMQRLIPDGDAQFQHDAEGPDDMPAHIRTILTQSFLVIPITNQTLNLGTWQDVFLWEHRLHRFERKLTVTLIGS